MDEKRGLFYTSLEEHSETVAIDVRRKDRVPLAHGCDEPHGVALDKARAVARDPAFQALLLIAH
jgi:hypothetical protein